MTFKKLVWFLGPALTLLETVLGQPFHNTSRRWGCFLGSCGAAPRSTGPGSRNWALVWLRLSSTVNPYFSPVC